MSTSPTSPTRESRDLGAAGRQGRQGRFVSRVYTARRDTLLAQDRIYKQQLARLETEGAWGGDVEEYKANRAMMMEVIAGGDKELKAMEENIPLGAARGDNIEQQGWNAEDVNVARAEGNCQTNAEAETVSPILDAALLAATALAAPVAGEASQGGVPPAGTVTTAGASAAVMHRGGDGGVPEAMLRTPDGHEGGGGDDKEGTSGSVSHAMSTDESGERATGALGEKRGGGKVVAEQLNEGKRRKKFATFYVGETKGRLHCVNRSTGQKETNVPCGAAQEKYSFPMTKEYWLQNKYKGGKLKQWTCRDCKDGKGESLKHTSWEWERRKTRDYGDEPDI